MNKILSIMGKWILKIGYILENFENYYNFMDNLPILDWYLAGRINNNNFRNYLCTCWKRKLISKTNENYGCKYFKKCYFNLKDEKKCKERREKGVKGKKTE